ncbi:MAG: hypothetical protein ACWA40_09545 [Planktomarina sp.]
MTNLGKHCPSSAWYLEAWAAFEENPGSAGLPTERAKSSSFEVLERLARIQSVRIEKQARVLGNKDDIIARQAELLRAY